MTTILSFIVVLGIIVFFHELGHFLAAKLSGVRVEIFSLGFPPKMIGKKIGETEYQLAWIPLGGFVKMTGMLDESFDEDFDPEDPRCFIAQPLHKRVFIITAGVLMNFLLGILIYSAVIWSDGVTTGGSSETVIGAVSIGSPADQAGLLPGDRIVSVDDQPVENWEELVNIVHQHPADPINVSWHRTDSLVTDSLITREITPLAMPLLEFKRDTVGKLGILGVLERESVNPFIALVYGTEQVVGVLHTNVISLYWLITGQARISELSGPVGIAKESGKSVRSGFTAFMMFIAFISVSIGFLNILPIPMLDGGHLFFMLIETAIRRPIPEKLKINMMRVGMALLILLILVVSYHDLMRVFFGNGQ